MSGTNEALHTELSQGARQAFTILLVLLSQVRGVKGVFLANQKVNGKVVTLITYNKGRDWDYLRPPSTDMNGKPTNCKPVSALLTARTFPGVGTSSNCRIQGSETLTSEKGHLRDMSHLFLWVWWRRQ